MKDKLVESLMNMCDDQIKLLLQQLRNFVDSNISENDYLGLGYSSREVFIDDVVSAMIFIHLNEKPRNDISQNTVNTRKFVSLKQYVCKKCGTINIFSGNEHNDVISNDENEAETLDNKTSRKKEAILFISKWTIFKLLTELFLYARCWFWGKCERPWYILWNKRTVKDK